MAMRPTSVRMLLVAVPIAYLAVFVLGTPIDGVWVGKDTSAPYSYTWDTSSWTDDVHEVKATAYDAAGNFTPVCYKNFSKHIMFQSRYLSG